MMPVDTGAWNEVCKATEPHRTLHRRHRETTAAPRNTSYRWRRQEQLLWWFPSWCLGADDACGHRSVERGVGAGGALRSLPTQTIPCFCDILKFAVLPGGSP
ncbi:uncharacterized protein AAGF69_017511 [Amazona ochrocephala]